MRSVRHRWSHGLLLAILMSLAFLGLSFLRTWGDLGSALFGGQVLESTLSQPIWGTRLAYRILGFVSALLAIHLALAAVAWLLAHASRIAFPGTRSGLRSLSCFWLLALISWILIANAAWFPHSELGSPYRDIVWTQLGPFKLFHVASGLISISIGGILIAALIRQLGTRRFPGRASIGVAAAVLIAVIVPLLSLGTEPRSERNDRPHVIVIGIDSLRADYVNDGLNSHVPMINEFLSGAVLFSDTVTPLARTFPAWVSIVSGQHPHSTGAIINLFPRNLIDAQEALPDQLRRAGYKTVYATDEVRFSNLDTSYGFDSMIAPPMGSADFLLGFVHDFPLSNLLVNSILGRVLFPFAHGNRAAVATYDPDTFVERLSDELAFEEPTFFAVHLTLPHWPYGWATSPNISADSKSTEMKLRYESSIERVDRQFKDVMTLLEERGALQNAIVVVLSDHGESLGETTDLSGHGSDQKPQFGHGTNVFLMEQYQVLLAVRAFGNDLVPGDEISKIDAPASLVDIAPTIIDLLQLNETRSFDGWSLAPLLRRNELDIGRWDERIRFIETEYNPAGFSVGTLPSAGEMQDASQTYLIDPETDLLSVRPDMVDEILSGRQFAAMRRGTLLAALPTTDNKRQTLVFLDRNETAVREIFGPVADFDPPVQELWLALSQRFPTVRARPIVVDSTAMLSAVPPEGE